MTREEGVKAVQEMDEVIERAERACQSYELIQMEMMAALARAKAIHKQLIMKRAELEEQLRGE
jgi:prefoldin subunit 5